MSKNSEKERAIVKDFEKILHENALFHVVLKEPFLGHGVGTEWSVAETLSHCYDKFDVMDM